MPKWRGEGNSWSHDQDEDTEERHTRFRGCVRRRRNRRLRESAGLAGHAARPCCDVAGIGGLGLLDDLLEPHQRRAGRPVSKGLRGHLASLRSGRVTTGAAKALGIPALALLAAAGGPAPRGGAMVPVDAALTAGCANLANLLDLRPGRALKAVLPPAALLALTAGQDERARSGARLAVAALLPGALALPADLREHGMLGDAGANVLGAAVGAATTRTLPAPDRKSVV